MKILDILKESTILNEKISNIEYVSDEYSKDDGYTYSTSVEVVDYNSDGVKLKYSRYKTPEGKNEWDEDAAGYAILGITYSKHHPADRNGPEEGGVEFDGIEHDPQLDDDIVEALETAVDVNARDIVDGYEEYRRDSGPSY